MSQTLYSTLHTDIMPYGPYSLFGCSVRATAIRVNAVRATRATIRASRSSEELSSSCREMQDHLRSGMYGLGDQDIPYGCQKEAVQQVLINGAQRSLGDEFWGVSPDFYHQLAMAFDRHDLDQLEQLYECLNTDVTNKLARNPALSMSLECEAVLVQMLIKLKRFDEAEDKVEQILSIYPHDDFTMYCLAEILIERPGGFWFFGPNKAEDLKQAKAILEGFDQGQDSVEIYPHKHHLAWSKYHLQRAKDADSLAEKSECTALAAQHAKRVPVQSVYHREAQDIVSKVQDRERDLSVSP